jgi:hypothetical protein
MFLDELVDSGDCTTACVLGRIHAGQAAAAPSSIFGLQLDERVVNRDPGQLLSGTIKSTQPRTYISLRWELSSTTTAERILLRPSCPWSRTRSKREPIFSSNACELSSVRGQPPSAGCETDIINLVQNLRRIRSDGTRESLFRSYLGNLLHLYSPSFVSVVVH